MPQHDWQQLGRLRYCVDCDARQAFDRRRQEWRPRVNPICPGEDDGRPRPKRPAPSGPGERTGELECA